MSFRQDTELRNNRYKIIASLGGGAYGKVYEIQDRTHGDTKALKAVKIYDPLTGELDKTAVDEIRVLKKLQGIAGIPVIFDDFCYKGFRCLVQEKFVGDLEKLRYRNRNSTLCNETVAKIGYQLTGILNSVHGRGIIHRDIKAANVMVAYPGSADHLKLIDFGLATIFSHASPLRVRRTRVDCNSIPFEECPYAAPRLCRHLKPQEREDLLMMGYLLITLGNHWPFGGNSPQQILAAKEAFESNPEYFLTAAQTFLGPIMRSICSQTYGVTPKYAQIQSVIKRSIHRFNPNLPFKLSQNAQGQWLLK